MTDYSTSSVSLSASGRRWRPGLYSRILLAMLIIAMVPLLVMAYQGYHCARQAIVANETTYLRSLLRARQEQIESCLARLPEDDQGLKSSTIEALVSTWDGSGPGGRIYLAAVREGLGEFRLPAVFAAAPARVSSWFETPTAEVREYLDHRDIAVIGAAIPLPELDCVLVVEKDKAEAFAWLYALQRRAFITGCFVLLAVLAIAVRSARKLAYPFQRLFIAAKRVAAGQYEERVEPLPGIEAEKLGDAFNYMMDELLEKQRTLVRTASLAVAGELSASVVHEIRNPLASIKLNLSAMAQHLAGQAPYDELAGIACQQVVRVERMLNELLAFGKPLALHFEAVRPAVLLEHVHTTCAGPAAEKQVVIELSNQLPGSVRLKVDPEQLGRVLDNLVINAIQVSSSGQAVELSIGREKVGSGALVFQVRDRGPGIPPKILDKLFIPFFTTREGGTGLGLANVKKVVGYHDGTAMAENHREGGALFTIKLPAHTIIDEGDSRS